MFWQPKIGGYSNSVRESKILIDRGSSGWSTHSGIHFIYKEKRCNYYISFSAPTWNRKIRFANDSELTGSRFWACLLFFIHSLNLKSWESG
jgi:hypothetical protein